MKKTELKKRQDLLLRAELIDYLCRVIREKLINAFLFSKKDTPFHFITANNPSLLKNDDGSYTFSINMTLEEKDLNDWEDSCKVNDGVL